MRAFLAIAALGLLFAGCVEPSATTSTMAPGPTLPAVPATTSFHFADGTLADAARDAATLVGDNLPVASVGGYTSIGGPTFEPSIGITSSGAIFVSSLRNEGPAGLIQDTHVLRGLKNGTEWSDVGPFLPGTPYAVVPNSNDPFLYVDPWTDRVFNFDMCLTLSGFCISTSDDDGASWLTQTIATGEAPALDHQSMAAAPAGELATPLYPNTLVFCINRGATVAGSWCSSSVDGGIAWTPLVPGFPLDKTQCSGLSGHLEGSVDGRFYRGNPSCEGPAVYRSDDGGLTWSEHTITTETGVLGHEVAVAADSAGFVYAFWIGDDGLPYLAASEDFAETWGPVRMVGAPGVTAAGFPAIAAGDKGRIAFTYIGATVADGYDGDQDDAKWNGYIGVATDALAERPLFTTVAVNAPDDPLSTGACGDTRCGGFGDFVGIAIDPEGRPWAALAQNEKEGPGGPPGIVGTLVEGPRLRGELAPLSHLELKGPDSFTT